MYRTVNSCIHVTKYKTRIISCQTRIIGILLPLIARFFAPRANEVEFQKILTSHEVGSNGARALRARQYLRALARNKGIPYGDASRGARSHVLCVRVMLHCRRPAAPGRCCYAAAAAAAGSCDVGADA